jgi:hypothetical protein
MKSPVFRLASCVLVVILAIGSPGQGLVSAGATQEVDSTPEVLLEAKVLSVPFGALNPLGLSEGSGSGSANTRSFLLPLAETEARSLVENPATKTVHSMTLHATSGNRTQFRIDTRVPGNSSAGVDTYFLVGIGIEATPTLRSNRVVSLMTGSVVQIRRGPPSKGVAPLLFETPLIRHELQIVDGMTILLGGFVAASNIPAISEMASVPNNPILNYVLSKGPKKETDSEIVVMLTPRLRGEAEPVAPLITAPAPMPSPPARPITAAPVLPQPELPVAAALPPAVRPNPLIPDSLASGATTVPAPPPPETLLVAPPAIGSFPAPLSPPPPPAVTPKVLIPASAASVQAAKSDLPAPKTVRLMPLPHFEHPAPLSAPPPPAVAPKALIPASAADDPPGRANLPVPVIETLAPSTRFQLSAPDSPLPPPAVRMDLPILVSSASTPSSNLLSIASAPPVKSRVPVPISVSLAPAATLNLPVPDAPTPPANKPPPTDAASHAVQVGAFRDRHRAEALAAEMRKRFGEAFIETDPALRTPYRVRLGQLPNLAAARQLQRKLRSQGFDSFVVFPTA